MKFRALKYLLPLILYTGALRSFHLQGIVVWLPLILAWVLIPALELFIKSDPANMSTAEEELAKADKTYDIILYCIVPLQYIALYFF
jgi:alkane 1-monooxygenase